MEALTTGPVNGPRLVTGSSQSRRGPSVCQIEQERCRERYGEQGSRPHPGMRSLPSRQKVNRSCFNCMHAPATRKSSGSADHSTMVWVADITFRPTTGPFVYLSLVTGAFSRKIAGHRVHDSLQTEQVSQAPKRALPTRKTCQPLIHHSDSGIWYCSTYNHDIHRCHDLRCSMPDG